MGMVRSFGSRLIRHRQGTRRFPSHQGAVDSRVVAANRMVHAPQNAQAVRPLSDQGKSGRNVKTRNSSAGGWEQPPDFFRCGRLGVKRLTLIRPTQLEQNNARTGFWVWVRLSPSGHR